MGLFRRPLWRVWPVFAALSLGTGLLLGAALVLSGQTQSRHRPAKVAPAPKTAPDAAVPFQVGERLNYRVIWSKYAVNAASLQLAIVERGNFFGQAAWHFRATAQTVQTMRMVYPLDDQFDSFTDAAKLTSVEYEMHLREQGKQQDNKWHMSANGEPAPADATAARVVPGTLDPVGFLYALRAVDWKKNPEFRSPVFDGTRLYDVVARLEEPADQVTVAAGPFTASRIKIILSQIGQEVTDTRFSLWLAQDAARTPVLIEADVPIGTARVELATKP